MTELPLHARTWILKAEGGYSNDPKDPGGETHWGISKRSYPRLDIRNLTADDAARIYARDYWLPAGCAHYRDVMALAVFDAAVNQGVRAAVTMLQGVVAVTADGIPGLRTIEAVDRADHRELVVRYLERRWDRYHDTGGATVFLRGWTRRLFRLEAVCLSLAV